MSERLGAAAIACVAALTLSASAAAQDAGDPTASAAADVAADRILGLWETEPEDDGQFARVDIERCGDRYCGRIVWLSHPLVTEQENPERAGEPKKDAMNPDEGLRERPILGLELLYGFRYDDGAWKDGRIYDPKSGNEYRCELRLEGGDLLKVRGFIKIAFIKVGRTTEWRRYEGDPGG